MWLWLYTHIYIVRIHFFFVIWFLCFLSFFLPFSCAFLLLLLFICFCVIFFLISIGNLCKIYEKWNLLRPFIDTNYTVSDNEMQRHRALAIIKPMKNMTGDYSCRVGSFNKADDIRSQYLQMIVPETHFYLSVRKPFEGAGNNLSVECTAKNIYPEPILTIS